jgi:hypothetical protein
VFSGHPAIRPPDDLVLQRSDCERALPAIGFGIYRHCDEMGNWPLGLAIGRVDVGDAGRVGAAPRPVIPRVGPKLAKLGAPAAGIEYRRRGLVGEQLGRALHRRQQALVDRPQQEGCAPHPIGQRRTVEFGVPWRAQI